MNDLDYRINNLTAISMVALAAVFDGFKFLLDLTVVGDFLTWIIAFVAFPLFFIWFLVKGVRYSGSKGGLNLLTSIAATVVDLVPFINMLPATTAGVVGIIINSRIEDMEKRKKEADPKKLVAIARLARMRAFQTRRLAASGAEQLPPGLRREER